MITPPARELLASIAASDLPYTDDDMPAAVLSLAGFVHSAPQAAQKGANVVTVPAEDSWVTLHASRPGSASDGRVAIVIERASAARSATVRLEAFGATPREREVATLLARGLSRVEIAESLVLSPHTVEDTPKPLRQARRRFAPRASRPSVPRRVPPRGSPEHPAHLPRTLRPRLTSRSTFSGCAATVSRNIRSASRHVAVQHAEHRAAPVPHDRNRAGERSLPPDDLEHCTSPPTLPHRSSTGTRSLAARPCFRSATGSCRSASANLLCAARREHQPRILNAGGALRASIL
jgi:hypothetical protein